MSKACIPRLKIFHLHRKQFVAHWKMSAPSLLMMALYSRLVQFLPSVKMIFTADTTSCSLEDIGRLIKRWGEMKGFTAHHHLQNLYESLVSKYSAEVKIC